MRCEICGAELAKWGGLSTPDQIVCRKCYNKNAAAYDKANAELLKKYNIQRGTK